MKIFISLAIFAFLSTPALADDPCLDLPVNSSLEKYNTCFRDMQSKIKILKQSLESREDIYSYSFRFKGGEILAKRQRPDNRLYFYATPGSSIKVSVYLATQKFPVNIVIDGKARGEPLTDSAEDIEVSGDDLEYQSIKQMKLAVSGNPVQGMPTLKENLRPKGVHYIEFSLGVGVTLAEAVDYEVSGVVVVTRKPNF